MSDHNACVVTLSKTKLCGVYPISRTGSESTAFDWDGRAETGALPLTEALASQEPLVALSEVCAASSWKKNSTYINAIKWE